MPNEKTHNNLDFNPPTNIINAVSKIQNYYLVEKNGPLEKEFFTGDHITAFTKVGLHSAFHDSIIWVIGYVLIGGLIYFLQENYLTLMSMDFPIIGEVKGHPLYWFTKMASFGFLLLSTGCCIWASRYYTGTVPKRAINTLFTARSIFLVSFALISFFLLGMLRKLLMDEGNITKIYQFVFRQNANLAEKIFYFIRDYFTRSLFESSILCLITATLSIIVPFITISYFRVMKRRKRHLGL
jgi:hypothetical protein